MKLNISWAIVFLAVSSSGIPAFHQIGSFASLTTCKAAVKEAEADMELDQWPDGFTAPKVRFLNSSKGVTLTGTAPGACEVVGANIKEAAFFMDGEALPAGTLAGRFTCNLDTTKFQDGKHTLASVVTFNDGTVSKLEQKLWIKNGTAPLPEMPKASVVHAGCVQKT